MNILGFLRDTLCMSSAEISKFSATAPHRYKIYDILKRNGKGKRTIAHPSKELKFIQRLLVKKLESNLPSNSCAMAYKKGISIKDNALLHANSKYLLKMDFKDFFPSITPKLFFLALEKEAIDITEEDKYILSNFLFWKKRRNSSLRLSIGAPSSPLVSNFVMHHFDVEMLKICEANKITYSRYADDLIFSTNVKDSLFKMPAVVEKKLRQTTNGLISINKEKTVFSSKGHNRHITGITLNNENKLSLGRDRKRLISSMIHKFKLNELSEEKVLELQGLLSFAKFIEPEFNERMLKKYSQSTMQKIFTSE
ncbi:retron St85 family RNA-directed DNA polymerase [Vreelandella alkaliphila]|uniref:retron St85 family RNA-directed DNA polymerase n=1 Tax=Vreelandella alkaliphila TaxID=272774 RepID=UPI0039F4D89A